MNEAMTYLTIQQVAKKLKCTTRTVYRKMDAIDTLENLVSQGHIEYEIHQNGNNRRLISEKWVESILSENEKIVKPRTSEKALWINTLKEQLRIKDEQIKEQANQINEFAALLTAAQNRTIELEKYYHINGMDNSPKLTPTRKQIEEDPGSVLNFEVSEKNTEEGEQKKETHIKTGDNKSFSEWIKSM